VFRAIVKKTASPRNSGVRCRLVKTKCQSHQPTALLCCKTITGSSRNSARKFGSEKKPAPELPSSRVADHKQNPEGTPAKEVLISKKTRFSIITARLATFRSLPFHSFAQSVILTVAKGKNPPGKTIPLPKKKPGQSNCLVSPLLPPVFLPSLLIPLSLPSLRQPRLYIPVILARHSPSLPCVGADEPKARPHPLFPILFVSKPCLHYLTGGLRREEAGFGRAINQEPHTLTPRKNGGRY